MLVQMTLRIAVKMYSSEEHEYFSVVNRPLLGR